MAAVSGLVSRVADYYLKHKTQVTYGVWIALVLSLSKRVRDTVRQQHEAKRLGLERGEEDVVAVNGQFFRRLFVLRRIMIPGIRSKEASLLALHTCFLVARTILSLYIAVLDGRLVAALVQGRGRKFLLGIVWWMTCAVPACFVNSMLTYLQAKLALQYRSNLTRYVHRRYLHGMTFYALTNLDDRIKAADHLITTDIANFSQSISELYSNIAKPVLDLVIYTTQLSRNIGGEGLFIMGLFIQVSANVLTVMTPAFGKYIAEEAVLEGDFRSAHSRIIEHSEGIALYSGHELEKTVLDKSYFKMIRHVDRTLRMKLIHGFIVNTSY